MADPGNPQADPHPTPDETLTRRAVTRYAVLDTPPDGAFDEIVDLACTASCTRAGGLAFLDRDRVWFKSRRGLAATETLRERYPTSWGAPGPFAEREHCSAAGVMILEAPFTLGEEHFAFWASAPVITGEGYHIGQLFVADDRAPGPDRPAPLAALARLVMTTLELRRTLMSYRAVVEGVGHVVFQLDDQHRLLSVTPTWGRLTGFGVVRSVGQPFETFIHPQDRPAVTTHLRDMRDRNVASTFECRLRHLLDGDRPVEIIAKPVVDESGRSHGLVGVIADISARKIREIEARHAHKLEALGRLSSGLAHEINTPIQFIGDNTRFLSECYHSVLDLVGVYHRVLEATDEGAVDSYREEAREAEKRADLGYLQEEIPSAIHQTLEGVERVGTLIQAMRTFSRSDSEAQVSADLNDALQAAVTVALTQVRRVARIECDFSDVPDVVCAISDLNEVFLNMIVNAADAIEDTGEFGVITIRTRRRGDDAVVEISDTGTGIPDDVLQHIFEPFFTTKDIGRGTGQGLALARAVVQDKHGGTISVTTRSGEGTTFTVTLPVHGHATDPEAGEGAPTPGLPVPEAPSGSEAVG